MSSRFWHPDRSKGRPRDTGADHERLVEVRLSRSALLHNLDTFRSLGPCEIAPVLKSNAYGHGIVEISSILRPLEIPFVIVDAYYEAVQLRTSGMRHPILLLGHTPDANVIRNRLPQLSFGIVSLSQLRRLSESVRTKTPIHLKIDTGMHRQGVLPDELDAALDVIESSRSLELEGVCSHLADADGPDFSFTAGQIEAWNAVAGHVRSRFPGCRYFHLAASSGASLQSEIDANVLRLGIGLYGMNTQPRRPLPLRPVMEVVSRLASVKWLSAGDRVGYNITFEAAEPMPLGVVPTGYYSCVDRRRSNNGVMLVKDRPCPIVGRVSMNITTIDLRPAWPVDEDAEVVVIGSDPEAPNSAERIARECDTIPYVILTGVAPELARRIV